MKKTILLGISVVCLAVAGCSTPAANPAAETATGTKEATGVKDADGKLGAMGVDQVQVTDAGKNADRNTGSALKGGN